MERPTMARKLSKKVLDEYRTSLLHKRLILTGSLDNVDDNGHGSLVGRDSGSGDAADQGAEALEQDFALSVLESEGNILQKIDAAILRIDKGGYGICQVCEKPILKARLNAIPWTALCVECQRQAEG